MLSDIRERGLGEWLGLDRQSLGTALRLALAAIVSLSIAAMLHIENAYWAAMPTWVLLQATRGQFIERGVFRIFGTILGAAVGFGLILVPVDPLVQCALLALWIAFCASLVQILRGMHSYWALMAGMTAPIVLVPSAMALDEPLHIAFARVECTLIGVIVVALVSGLSTPAASREAFYRRVRLLCADAVSYAEHMVRGGAGSEAQERRILTEMSEIDQAARPVLAGSLEGYRRLRHIDTLITASLGVMAAAQALRVRSGVENPEVARLAERMQRFSATLRAEEHTHHLFDEESIGTIPGPGRRLERALADLDGARLALAGLMDNGGVDIARPSVSIRPDRDWPLAIRAGAATGALTLAVLAIGIMLDEPMLTFGMLGMCIYAMLLSSMPVPQQIAPKLIGGAAIGVAVATAYRLTIAPHATTPFLLVASIAPFLVVGGFVRASRRTGFQGVEANMSFLMASQAGTGAAPVAAVFATSLSLLGAATLVSLVYMLLPRRADRDAARISGAIRRDLERMAAGPGDVAAAQWHAQTSRRTLRLMLHLARAGKLGDSAPSGLLGALNLGYAVAAMQDIAADPMTDRTTRQNIWEALETLRSLDGDPRRTAESMMKWSAQSTEPLASLFAEISAALLRAEPLLTAR